MISEHLSYSSITKSLSLLDENVFISVIDKTGMGVLNIIKFSVKLIFCVVINKEMFFKIHCTKSVNNLD